MESRGARTPEPGREMRRDTQHVQECDRPTQLLQDFLTFVLTCKSFAKFLCHRKPDVSLESLFITLLAASLQLPQPGVTPTSPPLCPTVSPGHLHPHSWVVSTLTVEKDPGSHCALWGSLAKSLQLARSLLALRPGASASLSELCPPHLQNRDN